MKITYQNRIARCSTHVMHYYLANQVLIYVLLCVPGHPYFCVRGLVQSPCGKINVILTLEGEGVLICDVIVQPHCILWHQCISSNHMHARTCYSMQLWESVVSGL